MPDDTPEGAPIEVATTNQLAGPSHSLYFMFSCWYLMFYPKGVKVLVSVCSWSSPVEYWQPLGTRYKDLRVPIPEL